MTRRLGAALALLLATVPAVAQQPQATDSASLALFPPGLGQLSQDVLAMRIRTGTLDIRVVPLEERALRLLAPDAYQALHLLLTQHRAKIDSIGASRGVRTPGVAYVSFYGLAPATRFDPFLLTLSQRNQLFRPIGTIPLSAPFSNQQLDVREQASGLVLYERFLPVQEPFTMSYLDGVSDDWERRLTRLDAERLRILGRLRSRGDSTSPTTRP